MNEEDLNLNNVLDRYGDKKVYTFFFIFSIPVCLWYTYISLMMTLGADLPSLILYALFIGLLWVLVPGYFYYKMSNAQSLSSKE